MINLWVFVITVFMKLVAAAAMTVPEVENTIDQTRATDHNMPVITRHAFFRSMEAGSSAGTRRVFGGAPAELREFPAVCALLDRYWAVRCTAAVLAEHWVLTAAHCVTPTIAYVKYNTRRPASRDGNVTAVYFLYRHPKYKVEQKDEGRGLDVTTLHHDVGLIRTRDSIKLASAQSYVLHNLQLTTPYELCSKNVQVLGFGRTEKSVLGEELFAVQLQLVGCEREDWIHCVCGVSAAPQGVCSGDSGGPVLCGGEPIGVTSMGPVECAHGGVSPPVGATSVFTALRRYADVINATILDTEAALRMRVISHAGRVCAAADLLLVYWSLLLNY